MLDLMLPDMDGLDVCRTLRRTSDVFIMMLTARIEEIGSACRAGNGRGRLRHQAVQSARSGRPYPRLFATCQWSACLGQPTSAKMMTFGDLMLIRYGALCTVQDGQWH